MPRSNISKMSLFPAIVARVTGRQLDPSHSSIHALQLISHFLDVGVRPFPGMAVVFDGGIFCRHAECVPADWMQDVEPLHAQVSAMGIADRIVPDMTHVDPAARIGKHFEQVVGFSTLRTRSVDTLCLPSGLPTGFNILWIVVSVHLKTPAGFGGYSLPA